MYEVKDQVVLVTGGAAGIGAEVVKRFLDEGAKYVAILDVDVEKGKAFEKELQAKHGAARVKFFECDVTDSEALNKCYDEIIKTAKYIDVLVNNAGILNDKHYKKAVAINVVALMESSFKAYNLMRKDRGGKGGTIINIASIAALQNIACSPVYCATKSAVLQFSVCLGDESHFSHSSVRVVTVCFGVTDTSIFDADKCQMYDEESEVALDGILSAPRSHQTPESAAKGLIEAYKLGRSGSTWLITSNKPAEDITAHVSQAYDILSIGVKE